MQKTQKKGSPVSWKLQNQHCLQLRKGSTMMSNSRPTFQKLKKSLQESLNMHLITILAPSCRCTQLKPHVKFVNIMSSSTSWFQLNQLCPSYRSRTLGNAFALSVHNIYNSTVSTLLQFSRDLKRSNMRVIWRVQGNSPALMIFPSSFSVIAAH
jgi:hypothetical protein